MPERRKLKKKENEKIVDVDEGGAAGEKEAADDGNDAGGVGNDAGVGTINVPAIASGWGVDEKQGSGKEMKKPGVIGKGGGEVSGGGVGLAALKNNAGDKILLSGTTRKKIPSFVAGGSGMGDIPSSIPNPNDPKWQQFLFALLQVVFSQMAPQAGGSMDKEESEKEEAAEEAVDLCSENNDKIKNQKN